ncbi:major facilitator superfamily domain-containing protein [Dactylonectria estremocensis]|uniref:Major facilitator superfamily domain-containing protein n=1 Tax=Dactylonectria estremocensis TaxID=1079267 RepID=A0A9P9EYB6_9HYPO|nr:major facilitator superfamily domain-containing protein [Dactylonectria estremocensis]
MPENDQEAKDLEGQPAHPPEALTKDEKPDENSSQAISTEPEYLNGWRLWNLFLATTAVGFLLMLDSSIVSTAIPHLSSEFHSLLDISWYGASYQLAKAPSACFQPMAGTLYTHLSAKWTFVSFFAIFELGSLLSGVATSSMMLIVARAVEGLGASGLQNGMFILISGCVPMKKRPALMGLGMGISQAGLVLGPVIGGLLTQYATWRWCFYINLPIGAAAMIIFLSCNVPENRPVSTGLSALIILRQKLDFVGFVFFAGAAVQLLLALQFGGNQHAWNSATIISLFCGAGATIIIFGFVEHRQGTGAMIPLHLVRQKVVWCSALVMLFSVMTSFCASYYLPIYFQAVMDASPSLSGVYLLPLIISQVIIVVLGGSISTIVSIGSGLISTYTPHTSTGKWIGYQIILGAGRGLGMQMPILTVQGFLPRPQIAIGTAFIMLGHTLGGAISLSIAQTIFSNSLRTEIRHYAPGVNTQSVISVGAAAIRKVATAESLPSLLMAYSVAVNHVFYFTVAAGACSFVFSGGLGWTDIRKTKLAK